MFTRVGRGELVLAAVGVLGAMAGLVLAVAAKLGITGPVLIGAGIVVAAAAAVPVMRTQVSELALRQRQQHDRLESILAVPVQPVISANPFTIGVFPSALAQAAQRDPPGPADQDAAVPPYVPRYVDGVLEVSLTEEALEHAGRLVVLRGDPKSGKSRTLWQAVQMLADRKLVAVRQPDPAADAQDPAFAPLATLAGLDRPISRSKGRDLLIWVDDAHTHLRRGLSRDTLRRLARQYPAAVIAMTIHSAELDGLQAIDPPLYQLLRRPFDALILDQVLRPYELEAAKDAYPALAGEADLARLPELLAAVNLLTERYRHHRADEPAGVAVARAAINWQRAGMPPGSIGESELRALAGLTLADIAPNRVLDEAAFQAGLAWATTEVAAFAAPVRREPASDSAGPRFRAFDALVSWARDHDPPLGQRTWDFVIDNAGELDRLGVGIAAHQAAQPQAAVSALQRAASSSDPTVAALALFYQLIVPDDMGRPADALAVYDQVVARFGKPADPALADPALDGLVAAALVSKGATLGLLGRPADALAVYDQVVARFGNATDPALAELVARALVSKGILLGKLGRPADALAVYDQVVAWFGKAADPVRARYIAGSVGPAPVGKGIRLGVLGRSQHKLSELALYDYAPMLVSEMADPALAEQVASALVNKGIALGMLGRQAEALAVYDQVEAWFARAADPALAEQVARARSNRTRQ